MSASASSAADRPGWRKTAFVINLSQFITFIGFAAAVPFAPFFIQEELGILDDAKVKLYTSLFAAATPITMAILAPVWGALGDRIGRRPMLIRANVGVGFTLLAMGFVTNIWQLLALRLLQGVFSGTQVAAQTLATSEAPPNRSGTILGTLSAVLFAGTLTGSALGGVFAELVNCRYVFKLAGLLSLVASVLVIFFVREQYGSAAAANRGMVRAVPRRALRWRRSAIIVFTTFPLLLALLIVALARSMDKPMLPLLVHSILGTLTGAKSTTSFLMSIGAVAGLLAGIAGGWMADRVNPLKLAIPAAILSALMIFPLSFIHGILLLYPAYFFFNLFSSVLEPALQNWLIQDTPERLRGTLIGWTATARAIGWSAAPLLSGLFAIHTGLPSVYIATAACFLLLCPLALWAGTKLEPETPELAALAEQKA